MLQMVLIGSTIDQDVVKKDNDELAEPRRQRHIHCPLKHLWCTSETEVKHPELILAKVCLESCFVFFTSLKQDLMESRTQVQFRKPGCTPNPSINRSNTGIANLDIMVNALRWRKSTQNL
jgi:hypothetical protein